MYMRANHAAYYYDKFPYLQHKSVKLPEYVSPDGTLAMQPNPVTRNRNVKHHHVPNPCCCCSRRAGSIAIAIYHIICGIAVVVLSALFLKDGNADILMDIFNSPSASGIESKLESKPMSTFSFVIVIIGIPISLLHTIFGCLLFHAIIKRKEKILRLWIYFNIATIIGTIFLTIVESNFTGEHKRVEVSKVVELGAFAMTIALYAWIISVVYYYREEIMVNDACRSSAFGRSTAYTIPKEKDNNFT